MVGSGLRLRSYCRQMTGTSSDPIRERLPIDLAGRSIGELTEAELFSVVEALTEGGIKIAFSGKQAARQIAYRVRPRTLTTVKKYSAGPPDLRVRNVLVEGDNLQAMVTLYKYRGQVDLIVTDPPYNTGQDFRYSDRWENDPNDDGIGDLVAADDRNRHTKWMRFMWPRLQMMNAMLRPGGVLAICIDDRELFHLGQMLDEMPGFGEKNRIGIINWQKNYTPRNDNRHISTATEYVLVYAKDIDRSKTNLLPRSDANVASYTNPDDDPQGPWASNAAHAPSAHTHAGMVYGIQHPFTGELIYPPERRCWAVERKTMKGWLKEWGSDYIDQDLDDGFAKAMLLKGSPDPRQGDLSEHPVVVAARKRARKRYDERAWPTLYFTSNGLGGPRRKVHLEKVRKGVIPMTYWADEEMFSPFEMGSTSWDHEQSGHNQSGVHELDAVVGEGHGFQTVKPLKLFQKLIHIWSPADGIVMDPFAGSGTTGHAVLALNSATGSSRRFVLIEQGRPQNGDPYARTLTSVRLQRVISGNWASTAAAPLPAGFTYQRLSGAIDGEALLRMERAEMRDTIVFGHFGEGRRRNETITALDPDEAAGYRYLVGMNSDGEGLFLVWDGPDKNTDLTREVYSSIVEEAKAANGVIGRYHVYARRWVYQRPRTTSFYQIPDYILASFGLNARSEPFSDTEAELQS